MICLLAALFVAGDAKAGVLLAEERLHAAEDKGFAKVELAEALWQDQDQEGAFQMFLEALNEAPKLSYAPDPEETKLYNEALELYLNHSPEEAQAYAQKIKQNYLPFFKEGWPRLGLLIAISHANTFDFEEFFTNFYKAYSYEPDHFLAYKTLALLHIKLSERRKNKEERAREKDIAGGYLQKAAEKFPSDFSLYRLQIAYAPPEEKDRVKLAVLNKIIGRTIIPPRRDALYFLDLAEQSQDKELLKRFYLKAKGWYPDSRKIQQYGN